jgi:hypothetical protein
VTVPYTATRTQTDTYTDARLRAVMAEVGADFYAPCAAGFITAETARVWTEELTFILQHRCARRFQLQCTLPSGYKQALHYEVSSDGSVQESSGAGGIDFFALPQGTQVGLVVTLDEQSPNIGIVRAYTQQRGWGTNGQAVQGDTVRDRTYSKDGYGIVRSKVGQWT